MNFAPYLDTQFPTPDSLRKLCSLRGPSRTIGTKAYLHHEDLTPVNLAKPLGRPGQLAAPNEVSRAITSVQTSLNVTADVMRTANFVLQEFRGLEQFNTVRDLLRLTLCYYDALGNVVKEVNLGYFSFVIPDRTIEGTGAERRSWQVTGQGLASRIVRKGFLYPYTIPGGFNLPDATKVILMMAKLPPSMGGRQPSGIVSGDGTSLAPPPPVVTATLPGLLIGAVSGTSLLYDSATGRRYFTYPHSPVTLVYDESIRVDPTTTPPQPYDPDSNLLCTLDISEHWIKPSGAIFDATVPTTYQVLTVPTTTTASPDPYTSVGVDVNSVGTRSGDYTQTPNGWLFNVHGGARVDPVSYAPLDPWTHHPMTPISLSFVIPDGELWQPSVQSLWYDAKLGVFTKAPASGGKNGIWDRTPYDVFRNQPLPAGRVYRTILAGAEVGNFPCPLASFPRDGDGSGPYFQPVSSAAPAASQATTAHTITGSPTVHVPADTILAGRSTLARDIAVLAEPFDYMLSHGQGLPDPDGGSHYWVLPLRAAEGTHGPSFDITGFSWPTGAWTVDWRTTANVSTGALDISVEVIALQADGTTHVLGTLTSTGTQNFPATDNTLTLHASGVISAYTAPAGRTTLYFNVSIHVATSLAGNDPQSLTWESVSLSVTYPPPTITVTSLATITDPPLLVDAVIPTRSGTNAPWPDSNNPAVTPAGCETIGPDIPSSRIHITPSDVVAPAPVKLNTQTNMLALLNLIFGGIQYENLWDDTDGNVRARPTPFSTNDPPQVQWDFNTYQDQIIFPGVQVKINDQTAIFNVASVRSENNGSPAIRVIRYNLSSDSFVSVTNLGDTIWKPFQMDQITDLDTLRQAAKEHLEWGAMGNNSVSLSTFPIPFVEPNDAVFVTIIDTDGTVIVDSTNNPYLVTQATIDIDKKSMSWVLGRWVPL